LDVSTMTLARGAASRTTSTVRSVEPQSTITMSFTQLGTRRTTSAMVGASLWVQNTTDTGGGASSSNTR
jgi:hypothetical protein